MYRLIRVLPFMALCLFVLSFQNPARSEAQNGDRRQSEKTRKQDRPQFKAEVDQVVIYATVFDKNGHLVDGLTKDDFKVYEDKVEQKIVSFGHDDVPATIGVVLDHSGSMRSKMDRVREAIETFLSTLRPDNQLFLIDFNDEATLEENFTRDIDDIRDALDNVVVSGGTALYDAIYLGVEKARKGNEPKKALLVFTDGEDKDSYYTQEQLLKKIEEEDVQVYLVAFLDEDLGHQTGFFGIFKSERDKVVKGISAIADGTGGRAYFPEKLDDLKPTFESIGRELRSQYRISYVSTNRKRDSTWRRVDVTLENARQRGLKIRAKRGYFAR